MDIKKLKFDYIAIAKSISRHVSSLEEVNFNKSSLLTKLAKDLKKKPDRKLRSKLESWWKNSCALRTEVRRIITGNTSSTCTDNTNSGDIVEDQSDLSQNNVSCTTSVDIPIAFTNASNDEKRNSSTTPSVAYENRKISSTDYTGNLTPVSSVSCDHYLGEETENRNISVNTLPKNSVSDTVLEKSATLTGDNLETLIIPESDNFDSASCDSIYLTRKRSHTAAPIRTYKRKCTRSPISKAETYDFTDNEDDVVKNSHSRKVSPQGVAKFKIDLGQKLVYSARFKDSDGIVTHDTIRRGLRVVLATEYGCTCTLRFSTIRTNEADVVAYARCMSVEHKQSFKFNLFSLHELKASVFAVSSDEILFKHEKRNFSQLRGAERQEVKNALRHRQPREYQLEVVKKIDPALAADGNMQDLKKLYIYQKAKSEDNCKDDVTLKSVDLSDLFQLWMNQNKLKDPYLRHVSLPLTAIMFTEAQLNLLEHSRRIVLHLDATGSVVRKPPNLNCKRIYYYVLVTKHNESVIPMAEMVTSEHNNKSIATFLKMYRFFVQDKFKTWPFVSAVVVDWSWAFLNSLLFEWNHMTINAYLNTAYSFVTEGRKPKNIIIVQTCCAHFMKRVSTIIKKDFAQYENRKSFLLECIALMMLCRQITELDCIFEHFVKAVSTPDADDAEISLRALCRIVAEQQVQINDIVDDVQNDSGSEDFVTNKQKPKSDPKSFEKSKAVFANSPFYIRFKNKLEEVESKIDRDMPVTNKYYVPGFARHMTERHMAYTPLWTSVMLDLVDRSISRLSNAYVESYNKVIKHEVLNHQKNFKISHFVRKLESYTRNLLAEADLDVPIKTRDRSLKPKYPMTNQKKIISSRSKGCHDVCNAKEHNIVELVPSKVTDVSSRKVDHIELDNCAEEAADPLIGEVWKDTKRGAPAKGHFRGDVLGHMLTEINKKGHDYKDISEHSAKPTIYVEDSKVTTLDRDNSETCHGMDHPVKNNSNVLPNGLFDDVEYYMQSKSHNVRIACFIADNNPPIRSNCFQLTARQFHTLTENRWIDGLVIDCYTMTHIDTWKDAMYLATDDTGSILGANWDMRKPASCGIYNITRTLSGKILMPYVYYGHWRLFVADLDDKTLTLFDPYENTDADEVRVREAFQKFVTFSNQTSTFRELRHIQWTTKKQIVRSYQGPHDGSNCGAYVAHYVECLAKNEPFSLTFDPLEFRQHMQKAIIHNSISLSSMCLYCFGKQYTDTQVTYCVVCQQWCHTLCVEKGDYDSETEEYEDDQLSRFKKRSKNARRPSRIQNKRTSAFSNDDFTCKLCSRYGSRNKK